MTEGSIAGSAVATASLSGSDVAAPLAGAGIEVGVSVGVGVGVGVLIAVAVGVIVAVAVSAGGGISVAGGTAVSVAGITNCTGVAVGSSPRQPAATRRNKNRLKISFRLMCHLITAIRCQVSSIFRTGQAVYGLANKLLRAPILSLIW